MMTSKMLGGAVLAWGGCRQGNLGVIDWNEDSFVLGRGGLSL